MSFLLDRCITYVQGQALQGDILQKIPQGGREQSMHENLGQEQFCARTGHNLFGLNNVRMPI